MAFRSRGCFAGRERRSAQHADRAGGAGRLRDPRPRLCHRGRPEHGGPVIAGASNALRVVVYEGEGSRPLDDAQRYDLMRTLLEKGYAVTRTRSGGAVSGPGESGGTMVVLGRFDRRQFAQADGAAGDLKLHFRDIEGQATAACVETVESIRG